MSPILTVNAGVRWEYEAPIDERLGRLANLDVAPGFTAVTPVVGNDSLRGDPRGHPAAHRHRAGVRSPGSSLVIRAGYGIYRNTSVYQPIALLLAQQPPLSKTLSVENSAANPLTLANGFTAAPGHDAQHVRGRSGLPRRLRAELAGARAARSAARR